MNDQHAKLLPVQSDVSDRAVAKMVKRRALAIGLDPRAFAGHSLRSGFITAAAVGVAERHIMRQSGHRSLPVLRGYIHEGTLFSDNAAAKVGL